MSKAVITQIKNLDINSIESLVRRPDGYFIRVEEAVTYESNFAIPVYTGNLSAKGNLNISRKLTAIYETTRTRVEDDLFEVSQAVAMAVYDIFKAMGNYKFENMAGGSEKDNWVIRNMAFGG